MVNFNYVVTAQKPTAVSHALVGYFTSPKEQCLILSKCTRLEIHLLTPEGLQPLHDVPIYGRISAMQLYRIPGESQDVLFISTERCRFCVLAYDAEKRQIITRANGDIQDAMGRPADVGQLLTIDPSTRLVGLHMYDGLLKVIPIDGKGHMKEAFNLRLEELHVLDMAFLHGHDEPTLLVLYQDAKDARHVKTYRVLLHEKVLTEGPWQHGNVEAGASLLIPVPAPVGGVILVGESTITYFNQQGASRSIHMSPTLIRAYGRVDPDGSRYLLGDHQGQLFVLALTMAGGHVVEMRLEKLGETSIPATISYLDNGFVYIGSSFGDSQLVRLTGETGALVEVLEQHTNLGPIVDFTMVDLEHLGQGQVVTCSGVNKDGSLRVVRNGIGITEHTSVPMEGIKGLWSLKGSDDPMHDRLVVLSFVSETRILALENDEMAETQITNFLHESHTLYCTNVGHGQLLQVTGDEVRLIDSAAGTFQSWRSPTGRVTAATANNRQVLVATGGNDVHLLQIGPQSLHSVSHASMPAEVACVALAPSENMDVEVTRAAVGLWNISVQILSLPDLRIMNGDNLPGEAIPRSVLITTLDNIPYLMCAQGDGHFFSYVLDPETAGLTERKRVTLGTQQITLTPFFSHNTNHVFACSDRPTVIYSSNKKLVYSNVNLREVNYVAPFNSESFPDSLTIATENSLTFGAIDAIQKLHIRKVPLGEMPRRIAHQDSSHSFGVVTSRLTVNQSTGEETETGFLRILDDLTFESTDQFQLEQYETGCAIISAQFMDDPTQYYLVGTAFTLPTESEPTRGRILVFSVTDGRLALVSEKETRGAVYCMSAFNGRLLAGVNSKILLFKWTDTEGTKELVMECAHHGHILCLYLSTRGDFILVGDLMKSVSLLLYKPVDGTLEEVAHDSSPVWTTGCEILDDDTFIVSENSFNLLTLRKNEGTTDEERSRLETVGEFHLGEFINRFRHGSLVMRLPETEGPAIPTLVYGSVNGSIGVIASLPADQFEFLLKMQSSLTKIIKGVGGFDHQFWRSFSNERRTSESRSFIDGDLIESYLDLPADRQAEVARQLNIGVDDLSRRIEELARIH